MIAAAGSGGTAVLYRGWSAAMALWSLFAEAAGAILAVHRIVKLCRIVRVGTVFRGRVFRGKAVERGGLLSRPQGP